LIGSLPTIWVDWDDSILQDIDNPEDYEHLLGDNERD